MRRVLFVDQDCALDRHEDRQLAPNVVSALLTLRAAGFELVLLANPDRPQGTFSQQLESQGIAFRKILPADLPGITPAPAGAPRSASLVRETKETKIRVELDLDRAADPVVATGLGFFDHMLEQLGKHAGIALRVTCAGDLHIDEHHTVEDCALAVGTALREALGDKRGIARYGFTLPMDESLASAALDLSGRSCLVFEGRFTREYIGDLPTELVPHFFRSLCDGAGMNLHLRVSGENNHHMVEACFKAVARALRQALRREGDQLPSTKGSL